MKKWKSAKITVSSDHLDLLGGELAACGTVGFEERQTQEGQTTVVAYFPEGDESWQLRIQALISRWGGSIAVSPVANEDWATSWRQNFPSMEIVPGISIVPSWEKKKLSPQDILLDPGMAFGTGTHQTTRTCARAIYDAFNEWTGEKRPAAMLPAKSQSSRNAQVRSGCSFAGASHPGIFDQSPKDQLSNSCNETHPQTMLDVGTGSGILSIVGARLGIKDIVAVDNDPIAIDVARENFEKNHVEVALLETMPKRTFDLVVANILLTTLIELSNELIGALNKGGRLILSGITLDQETDLMKVYTRGRILKRYEQNEWLTLMLGDFKSL